MNAENRKFPWLAASLSLLVPGLGQIYAAALVRGIAIMAAFVALASGGLHYLFAPGVGLGMFYLYALLALGVYVYALVDAYLSARSHNRRLELTPLAGKDAWLAVFLSIWLPGLGHVYAGRFVTAAVLFAPWLLLNLSWFVFSLPVWLVKLFSVVLPFYAVSVAWHAHYFSPTGRAQRRGLKLFLVVALVVLVAVVALILLIGGRAFAVLSEKLHISRVRAESDTSSTSDAGGSPSAYPLTPTFSIGRERLESLRNKRKPIEDYLASVEKVITALLPGDGVIPGMIRFQWRQQLHQQSENKNFSGYSVTLWSEANPKGMVRLYLRCNIHCHNQVSFATVGPTLAVVKPEKDIRFGWYINTGKVSLDKKIRDIVQEKAQAFQ